MQFLDPTSRLVASQPSNPAPSNPAPITAPITAAAGLQRLRLESLTLAPATRVRDLTYQPNDDTNTLTLTSPTRVILDLTAPIAQPGPDLLPPYFGFDFDVERVALTHTIDTGRPSEIRQISSLLAGQARLQAQPLQLTQGQFLIWDDASPGITRLRSLQLETEPPEGIHILASGRSRTIAAGLYPSFPVETLRSRTWLARLLSPEAFSTFVGFLAAVTAFLVPVTLMPSRRKS